MPQFLFLIVPIPVPSLSTAGWVSSPAEKADLLLSHYFLSMKSQSYVYDGKVSSVQAVVEQFGHDITVLTQQLTNSLEAYLRRYYDSVLVNITNNNNTTNNTSAVDISIHATVTDGSISYSIGRLLQINNSKIDKIIKINNG